MNTSLATSSSSTVAVKSGEIEVSATTPQEMLSSNQALIAWCEHKIRALKADASELMEAFNQAVAKKWKSSTLKRHADIAGKRVTFFKKIKAALEAGYYIVPNFPVDLFAVRTDKGSPKRNLTIGTYNASAWHFKQPPAMLPAGEGEYKPNDPLVETAETKTKDEKGNQITKYFEQATDWGDIDFPISMAKPTIMEATGRAMALKIFDQFGLFAPGTGDPIIVGEIVDASKQWSPNSAKRVTFIIAWRLDTKDL